MSDLYLVLRQRLPSVDEWVELGTDTMRAAQKKRGLSAERMGRELNISEKTWRRWVERGAVPPADLARVADALRLQLEPAEPQQAVVDGASAPQRSPFERSVLARLDEIERRLEELAGAVGRQADAAALQAAETVRLVGERLASEAVRPGRRRAQHS